MDEVFGTHSSEVRPLAVPTACPSSPGATSRHSPPSASHSAATFNASLVLPTPPGPEITRTDPASSDEHHPRSASSSEPRPVNSTAARSGRSSAASSPPPGIGSPTASQAACAVSTCPSSSCSSRCRRNAASRMDGRNPTTAVASRPNIAPRRAPTSPWISRPTTVPTTAKIIAQSAAARAGSLHCTPHTYTSAQTYGPWHEDVPVFVELESGGPPPRACQVVGVGQLPSHPDSTVRLSMCGLRTCLTVCSQEMLDRQLGWLFLPRT